MSIKKTNKKKIRRDQGVIMVSKDPKPLSMYLPNNNSKTRPIAAPL